MQKPLAAASKIVEAGNRVVLDPEPGKSFIENIKTGERMKVRVKKGVYVVDVRYEDGKTGVITLDSGAGVSVWPKDQASPGKMLPRDATFVWSRQTGRRSRAWGRRL